MIKLILLSFFYLIGSISSGSGLTKNTLAKSFSFFNRLKKFLRHDGITLSCGDNVKCEMCGDRLSVFRVLKLKIYLFNHRVIHIKVNQPIKKISS